MPVIDADALDGVPATFISAPTPISATSVISWSDCDGLLGRDAEQTGPELDDCRVIGAPPRIRRSEIAPLAFADGGRRFLTFFFAIAASAT